MARPKNAEQPKYLIFKNLTAQYQIIVPDDSDRNGREVKIDPYGITTLKYDQDWLDDTNLAKAIERKLVEVMTSNERVRNSAILEAPFLTDPSEIQAAKQIVFGEEGTAAMLIGVEPEGMNAEHGSEANNYLKNEFSNILRQATQWLTSSSLEHKDARLAMIAQRQTKIARLP